MTCWHVDMLTKNLYVVISLFLTFSLANPLTLSYFWQMILATMTSPGTIPRSSLPTSRTWPVQESSWITITPSQCVLQPEGRCWPADIPSTLASIMGSLPASLLMDWMLSLCYCLKNCKGRKKTFYPTSSTIFISGQDISHTSLESGILDTATESFGLKIEALTVFMDFWQGQRGTITTIMTTTGNWDERM